MGYFNTKIYCSDFPVNTIQWLDAGKIALHRASPQLGPRLLFFSGGSALKELSRSLIHFTHNSLHVITSFDSGGSSAELRKAFNMPAVGDIRNRLMALVDQGMTGNPELSSLFTYRLPSKAPKEQLFREIKEMVAGRHSLVQVLPLPMRSLISSHLDLFLEKKPGSFNPKGGSVGNLLLTAGYLEQGRRLDPAIDLYTGLANIRGRVRPVLDANLQLRAVLENGTMITNQHLLTGKQSPPITSRVRKMYLSQDGPGPVQTEISAELKAAIARAELICYPMGSFFSSLIANLLPRGVSESIAKADCPKVFIPNTYNDPECYGLGLHDQVEILLSYLKRGEGPRKHGVLDFILLDVDKSLYQGSLDAQRLREHRLQVLEQELVTSDSSPRIDPQRLLPILLSLAKG